MINVACSCGNIFGYLGQRSAPVRRFVFIWNFTCSAADWNNCDINPICIHANELLSIDEIEYELEQPSGRCPAADERCRQSAVDDLTHLYANISIKINISHFMTLFTSI